MKFSVFNNGTRAYDYYDAPGTPDIHAGAPPRVHGTALGATPDQAAWRLPAGARKVGSGTTAQGRIASLGGTDSTGDWKSMIVPAAIGYIIWRTLR